MSPQFITPLLTLLAFMNQTHATTWEQLPPLPESNGGGMAGCVGGKIIIAGGTNWRDGIKHWLEKVWVFDPATKQWRAGPALPHPLAYAAFASDDTRLYFAGGTDGKNGRREVYALDAKLQLTHLGNLPRPVVFGGAAMQRGKLSVFGGTPDPDDLSKVTTELHAVNLTDGNTIRLAPLTTLPHGVSLPAVAVAGNDFYAFTGAWLDPVNQKIRNVAAVFRHDGVENSWHSLAPYPLAARGVVAVALDDRRIYVAGGHGTEEQGFLSTAFIYDAAANRYTPAAPLPFAAATCLVKCGKFVYALGGEDKMKHRTAACWRIPVAALLKNETKECRNNSAAAVVDTRRFATAEPTGMRM